jgi:hypothetical protein
MKRTALLDAYFRRKNFVALYSAALSLGLTMACASMDESSLPPDLGRYSPGPLGSMGKGGNSGAAQSTGGDTSSGGVVGEANGSSGGATSVGAGGRTSAMGAGGTGSTISTGGNAPSAGSGGTISSSGSGGIPEGSGGRRSRTGGSTGSGGAPTGSGGAPEAGGGEGVDAGPSSCMNGVKDGDETDVDCGGGECPPCDVGKKCRQNTDCAVGQCELRLTERVCDN